MFANIRCISLIFLLAASAFGAKHYSYTSAGCTIEEIQPRAAAAALTDFTIYIGDGHRYAVAKIATDAAGSTYITGTRDSDVFVSKLDPTGALLFTATFGGSFSDYASAIAVDSSSNIYVAGQTQSDNFPLRGALQRKNPGMTGFLLKLSTDGSRLIYSTLFGGTKSTSVATSVVADSEGDAYVAGYTASTDFPATTGLRLDSAPAEAFHYAAYFAKVSPNGGRLVYAGVLNGKSVPCTGSGCLSANRSSSTASIALDSASNLYVFGSTDTYDFPTTTGAFRTDGRGAFVTKVKADGTGLAYSTYLSGYSGWLNAAGTGADAIAVDAAGNAYIAGTTIDPKFPVSTGAYQRTFGDASAILVVPSDVYVAKLNPPGSALVWATYLGAAGADTPTGIALDAAGHVWIAGTTSSPKFPNKNGWDAAGSEFLAELNDSATALLYSARFPANTVARAVAFDGAGVVHLAGAAGLVSTYTPGRAVAAHIAGIASSADGVLGGHISPSSLITIRGAKLGPMSTVNYTSDADGRVPKKLGGVTVKIAGLAAPLLSVSATEIRAVVPAAVAVGTAPVTVTYNSTTTPEFEVLVSAVRPIVFGTSYFPYPETRSGDFSDGSSNATTAVNEDGTVNSDKNPAKAGSVVAIWATGTGAVTVPDGTITTKADDSVFLCSMGGTEVVYAGPAPGMVAGVTQINFVVPSILNPLTQMVSPPLTCGGVTAPQYGVYVTSAN